MPPESGFRLSAYRHPHKSGSISLFSGRCACRFLQCRRKRQVSFHLLQFAIYPSNTPPFLFALRLQAKVLIAPYPWRKNKSPRLQDDGLFFSYRRAGRRIESSERDVTLWINCTAKIQIISMMQVKTEKNDT